MSDNVVDFLHFKAHKKHAVPDDCALNSALLHDLLVDFTAVLSVLGTAAIKTDLNLSQNDQSQLDCLALLAQEFLEKYEELGMNQVDSGPSFE